MSGRSSGSSNGLILRVTHTDGSMVDVFLAAGLTIGRSEANTIRIADDESVDRSHARVESTGGGAFVVRVESHSGRLIHNETEVAELSLQPGVCF